MAALREWLERRRLRTAARALAHALPPVLAGNWGLSETYTVGQIQRALEMTHLMGRCDAMAFAAFLSLDDYDVWSRSAGARLAYDEARRLFLDASPSRLAEAYRQGPMGNIEAATRYGVGQGG